MRFSSLSILAALALTACSADKEESAPGKPPVVVITTSKGTITVELDPRHAPLTVDNFIAYVEDKHYDGTVFHRVISDFMIQGGGFALEGDKIAEKETGSPIKNEAKTGGLSNLLGTIAMARTNDPHSATSQFFINVKDNTNLDPGGFSPDGYAVFGKVIEGMEAVEKIRTVKTGTKSLHARRADGKVDASPFQDVPLEDVVIESIRVAE